MRKTGIKTRTGQTGRMACWALCILVLWGGQLASGKVDLVTLPERGDTQLTIYNSADLTLVRETRALPLTKGINELQFGWANTLIDPTSLEMIPKEKVRDIGLLELTYPPRTQGVGVWRIQSKVSGEIPFEITYFASGIRWRAFYMATLTEDEKNLRLKGYVRVSNQSGEDYPEAQTRLIVGKINTVDEIVALAQRKAPYGSPVQEVGAKAILEDRAVRSEAQRELKKALAAPAAAMPQLARPKEIAKEGLSEYFLYTIEGTETIPSGESKRLPSFDQDEVPAKNLYKYERDRYGDAPVRFLSFKNNEEHKLGKEPLPNGMVKVFRALDEKGHLEYVGSRDVQYVPVGEDVELQLGSSRDVQVKPVDMEIKQTHFEFDSHGNISGWDDEKWVEVKVFNHRSIAVRVECRFNIGHANWELDKEGSFGDYEKIDKDTVQFSLELAPHEEKVFTYHLTEHRGTRAH